MKKPVILARRILKSGEPTDLDFLPPLKRRRLSPLQRIFFHLAHFENQPLPASVVFASQDGEVSLMRRTIADFNADGTVSPAVFSTSVYNAAPGLWSVITHNRAPYTAIAGGAQTIRCGLIEVLSAAVTPTLFVYAEETGGGHGFSFLYAFDR